MSKRRRRRWNNKRWWKTQGINMRRVANSYSYASSIIIIQDPTNCNWYRLTNEDKRLIGIYLNNGMQLKLAVRTAFMNGKTPFLQADYKGILDTGTLKKSFCSKAARGLNHTMTLLDEVPKPTHTEILRFKQYDLKNKK